MKDNEESSFEMKETNLFSSTSHHVARVDGSASPASIGSSDGSSSNGSSNCYYRRPHHARLDSNDDSIPISPTSSSKKRMTNLNGFSSDSFDDEYDHESDDDKAGTN